MQHRKPRARDLGVPFDGTPGQHNAITDVAGVEVGYATLISGEGALRVGDGPVRTGVTAILPHGKQSVDPVFAGWFALNGNGEMTGTTWVRNGFLEGPVMITNTHSVGVVRDSVIAWQVEMTKDEGRRTKAVFLSSPSNGFWSLPVVGETYDGFLNDINGMHVEQEHVFQAWTVRTPARWRKETSAAAPAWSATSSKAAWAPHQGRWTTRQEDIP